MEVAAYKNDGDSHRRTEKGLICVFFAQPYKLPTKAEITQQGANMARITVVGSFTDELQRAAHLKVDKYRR